MTSNPDPLLIKLAAEAMARQSQGDRNGALVAYKRIQRQFPDFADAWTNASVLLFNMERYEEALDMALRAAEIDSENNAVLFTLASIYNSLGHIDEAAANFQKVIELYPGSVPALTALAGIFTQRERPQEAIDIALRALELDPKNTDALCTLAIAHRQLKLDDTAIEYFQKTLEQDPKHISALLGIAVLYTQNGCFALALNILDKAIQIEPLTPCIWAYRSHAKMWARDLAGAEADLTKAVELDENDKAVNLTRGVFLLLQYRYREAWPYYQPNRNLVLGAWRNIGEPHWKGEQLNGQTLLIYTEHHGFGDVIQFARFFPCIKRQYNGRLMLLIYEPLKQLLSNLPGVDEFVIDGEALPSFDYAIPLLKLPVVLNIAASELPPPIKISPKYRYMPEFDRSDFKVGLVWGGNPTHTMDKHRSMNPRFLDELADMAGIAWYGLQIPPSLEPPKLPGFIDMSSHIGDFMDTAQIARQLDLLVTVDTSTAHLAGTLSMPTIVLLPHLPEWRWGLDSQHSPWYPYRDFVLLRQNMPNDWPPVISQLRTRITEFMSR